MDDYTLPTNKKLTLTSSVLTWDVGQTVKDSQGNVCYDDYDINKYI